MCLLILLRGFHEDYPILVASNRDEQRERKAAPPGLYVGENRRMISPRDRRAGGTWLAVNDRGMFAGLTNIAPAGPREEELPDAPSRGHLPHLALDQADLAAGVSAVREELQQRYNPFQLILCDGLRTVVVRSQGNVVEELTWEDPVLVASNEHRVGKLSLRGLDRVLGPVQSADRRLELMRPLLQDKGGMGRHRVLKIGGDYGTVSSSLIAVHRSDPRALIWRYAPGPPGDTTYRNYGNLGRRLSED